MNKNFGDWLTTPIQNFLHVKCDVATKMRYF